MKLFKITVAVISLLIILLTSRCTKPHDDSSENQMTVEKLAGTYKVTALLLTPHNNSSQQDLFSTLDACQKESKQVLNADKTYRLIDECSSDNQSGAWSVRSGKITINGVMADLISFNGSNLIIEMKAFEGTIRETLTRQ